MLILWMAEVDLQVRCLIQHLVRMWQSSITDCWCQLQLLGVLQRELHASGAGPHAVHAPVAETLHTAR